MYRRQKTTYTYPPILFITGRIPFTVITLFRVQLLIYRDRSVTGKLFESGGRKEKLPKFRCKMVVKCAQNHTIPYLIPLIILWYKCIHALLIILNGKRNKKKENPMETRIKKQISKSLVLINLNIMSYITISQRRNVF